MSTPKALLKALDARDGRACAWHWVGACDVETLVPHHRANRGMGGRKSLDRLSNLVWLCDVNSLIESDHEWAVSARLRGIKISSHADPDAEPITHAVHGRCFLNDDGTVTQVEKEVA
jgi:hypothetical protein